MAKIKKPEIGNPLAGMGLDEIVRNITAPEKAAVEIDKETAGETPDTPRKTGKSRRGGMKAFEENLARYTGVNEQGIAIWLPKEVKKKLELIRVNASRNIPLRSLASAIIMTYISENEDKLNSL
ncbi:MULTISPECIES: hypothetical protein [Bacteroidaceae]|jgi:hypothetical protein|nr:MULTISPECIES: hypothetical protein [Bacteroidaceae]MCE9164008.1 hypothetical protein [Bacteroides ovatus]MDB1090500.1 hypothetical protein [Phocaeicola vulgatus]